MLITSPGCGPGNIKSVSIGIINLSLLFLRVLPYGNGFAERAFAVKSLLLVKLECNL
jgi:hypothetical protein